MLVACRAPYRQKGSVATLDDLDSPAFMGRSSPAHRVAVTLDFSPLTAREEASLMVLMNESHHYEISIVCTPQRMEKLQLFSLILTGSIMNPNRLYLWKAL